MDALFLLPGGICLLLGIIFLLVSRKGQAGQEITDRLLAGEAWGRLTGTGQREEEDFDNIMRTMNFGIYEYDTADGQHISSASRASYTNLKDIPGIQGDMVKLRYDREHPAAFSLQEEQVFSRSFWPAFRKTGIRLTVIGVIVTAVTAAALLGLFDSLLKGLFEAE